jgi:methylated-DNA-[protein]-cysteine S-methyltransferase
MIHNHNSHPVGDRALTIVGLALAGLAVDPPTSLAGRIFAQWCRVASPIGDVYVTFTGRGISFLRTAAAVHHDVEEFRRVFRARFGGPLLPARRPPAGLLPALRTGNSRRLTFDLHGLSEFERAVLAATQRIPAGQIRSYGWVASEIGWPRAVRAVGSALARNPVPVLIPCHRVTRSDGTTGGYVFGAATKEQLLRLEKVNLEEVRDLARAGILYVGSETTRIVCFPTCHHARRITRAHRAGFRGFHEAVRAGYRPCRHCQPGALAA